ncbi:MAG: response regulator [Pseudomonadota bacterium]
MNAAAACQILLVEDNPDDAEMTIRALRKQNVANDLVWVKDGAEALDFLFRTGAYQHRDGAHNPKVVLLDLRLPKVDGIEVLQRLRADPRTKTVPVVILTSSTQDEDRIRTYELGANSYVSKPVKFEEFARVVSQLGLYWLMINKPPAL